MKLFKSQKGFSLIEILMVLILIAVLAAIAINAFINFRPQAENAAIQANLKVLRNAIAAKYGQMQLSCGTATGVFPPVINLNANDITSGATPCTAVQIPVLSERAFVQGNIPIPLQNVSNVVIDCTAGGDCIRGDANACDGTAVFTNQWCYRPTTGEIWMDSATPATEAL